jgi:pyruvate kinase
MPRRTKIVATLGPATDEKGVLDDMIQAGMDVVRLNFSYGDADDHIKRAESVRNRARANALRASGIPVWSWKRVNISHSTHARIRRPVPVSALD